MKTNMNPRKQCHQCSKRRETRFFETPRTLICDFCKIANKAGKKKEKRELSSKTWIKRLDALVGARVRNIAWCQDINRPHACTKVWQWAHGISRSYHNTRWESLNGWCLCSGAHKYYTNRPLEWDDFLITALGSDIYNDLKKEALSHKKIDYKALYEQLLNKE